MKGARGNTKAAIESFPERVKAIRTATGLTQEDFLVTLRKASAAVLGEGTRKYSQSTLSRLESGRQSPTLEDLAVLAACDPEGRGKLWLGWDEATTIARADKPERAPHPVPAGGLIAGRNRTIQTPPRRPKKTPRE